MNEAVKLKKATYHLKTFLVSKMIGSLGANVYAFAISMYILALTGSSLTFATNMLLSVLPRTLISPVVGVLGDRIPRKWLVLGGQLGQAITILILLLYTLIFDISILAIYIATIFNSMFNAFSSIAFTASIANLVDQNRIQKAMSINQMSFAISGIAGPVFGGMLYGITSITTFLLIYMISLLLTFSLEATMNFELYKTGALEEKKKQSMLTDFKEGIIYLKQQKVVSTVILAVIWINFFFCSVNVGSSFVFVTVLDMSPKYIGMIEGGLAVGMLATSVLFASKLKVKYPLLFAKRSIIAGGVVVIFTALPLIVSFNNTLNFMYYFFIMFLFGAIGVATNTPLGILLQTTIDENYRTRVIGILEMMSMCMMPIGTMVYGVLFDKVSAEILFLGSGVCIVIMALKQIRREIVALVHPEIKIELKKNKVQSKFQHEFDEINETYYANKVSSIQRTNFRYFR